MGEPSDLWRSTLKAVTKQGKAVPALSSSGIYVAFLSKTDWNDETKLWDLFFEVLAGEIVLLAYAGAQELSAPAPSLPCLGLHVRAGVESVVLATLGLKGTDFLAEGSWYIVELARGGDPETQVVGDLYDPDIDIDPKLPDHGDYHIRRARLLFLPGMRKGRVVLLPGDPGRAPMAGVGVPSGSALFDAVVRVFTLATAQRYAPIVPKRGIKRPRSLPRLTAPPPVSAVGVMDVGQGGCNLLLDINEPYLYYDAGYPLWFYVGTLPAAMRFGSPAYQGPITNNATGTLEIILSHWDWDHWRLGRVEPLLANLLWTVPFQPVGPVTMLFVNNLKLLGNINTIAGGPVVLLGPSGTFILRSVPPAGAVPAVVMNNSGLALLFQVQFPGPPLLGDVALTGDASFGNLPAGAVPNLTGIAAVHHGSIAHGAAANLPAPPPGVPGRIAYSYGMTAAGNRAYGFPVPLAVALYQAANWGNNPVCQTSTAEGGAIRALGAPAHGNIRMGLQTPLAAAYNATAFFPINSPLT